MNNLEFYFSESGNVELNRKVQEILFSNGCRWNLSEDTISYLNSEYIHVSDNKIFYGSSHKSKFLGNALIVTDPQEFIDKYSKELDEGDKCPECGGVLVVPETVNCSCHINPPCAACTEKLLTCDECGWEYEDTLRPGYVDIPTNTKPDKPKRKRKRKESTIPELINLNCRWIRQFDKTFNFKTTSMNGSELLQRIKNGNRTERHHNKIYNDAYDNGIWINGDAVYRVKI